MNNEQRILNKLDELHEKMTDYKDKNAADRMEDREILIKLKEKVEHHLESHSGAIGNIKYIGTAIVALVALIKSFFL